MKLCADHPQYRGDGISTDGSHTPDLAMAPAWKHLQTRASATPKEKGRLNRQGFEARSAQWAIHRRGWLLIVAQDGLGERTGIMFVQAPSPGVLAEHRPRTVGQGAQRGPMLPG